MNAVSKSLFAILRSINCNHLAFILPYKCEKVKRFYKKSVTIASCSAAGAPAKSYLLVLAAWIVRGAVLRAAYSENQSKMKAYRESLYDYEHTKEDISSPTAFVNFTIVQ